MTVFLAIAFGIAFWVTLAALVWTAADNCVLRLRLARAEAERAQLQSRPSTITVTVGPSLPPSIATRDSWTLSELEGGL